MKTIRGFHLLRFAVVGATQLLLVQGAESGPLVEKGRAALGRNDPAAAQPFFEQALALDRAAGDTPAIASDLFYLGLTQQQVADTASAPAQALAAARGYYLEALRARPKFAAASNNLAEVYRAEDNRAGTIEALRQAVAAAAGPARAVYAEKLGTLLWEAGDWAEGCRNWALAAGEQPGNAGLRQRLVDGCLKVGERDALIGYIWDLAQKGQVLQMQSLACDQFRGPGWSGDQRAELAAIVATCLAAQTYPPAAFEKQESTKPVLALKDDPAMAELVAVCGEKAFSEKYPWWRGHIVHGSRPRRGVWPQEAFRNLVRSLAGRWQSIDPSGKRAEAYYELAAFLDPREPDLEAITRLAEIYGTPDKLQKLDEMMRKHERELFDAKAMAYQTAQLDKIYQFHTTLGVIYSKLGVIGDEKTPASAVFQLEHAEMIAERSRDQRPGLQAIQTPPKFVNLLAETYVQAKQPEKAFAISVRKADEFARAGNTAGALEVVRAAEKLPVPAATTVQDRQRFETVKKALPVGRRQAGTVLPQEAVATVPRETSSDPVRTHVQITEKTPGHAELKVPATLRLSAPQTKALKDLVDSLLAAKPALAPGTGKVQQLPATAARLNVKEVYIKDGAGHLVMTNTTEVPFVIQ